MTNLSTSRAIGRPNIEEDAAKLWDTLSNGGTAIFRSDVGYGVFAATREGVERINRAKGRGAHKRIGISMNHEMSEEIHVIDPRGRDMINLITKDYDLPLGVVATYRPEHPYIQAMDDDLLALCTANGTIGTGLNSGGPFHRILSKLAHRDLHPYFGSSANVTGTGQRYRVEDIDPEIIEVADVIFDYGKPRWHYYGLALTMINFDTMQVLRYGACYDLISDALKRHFDFDLPADPGRAISPAGHSEHALKD